MDALTEAINWAGSMTKLAELLGVRQSAVSNWRMRGRIPADRCADIVRVTGGKVSFIDLCPDMADVLPAARRRRNRAA